jgi:hypothetical protein
MTSIKCLIVNQRNSNKVFCLKIFILKGKKSTFMEDEIVEEHWDKKMLSKTGEHFYPKYFKNLKKR